MNRIEIIDTLHPEIFKDTTDNTITIVMNELLFRDVFNNINNNEYIQTILLISIIILLLMFLLIYFRK